MRRRLVITARITLVVRAIIGRLLGTGAVKQAAQNAQVRALVAMEAGGAGGAVRVFTY